MKKETILFYMIGFLLIIIGIFFDKEIVLWLAQKRIYLLNEFMARFTFFGAWFCVFVIMTLLFLWYKRKRGWIAPLWLSLFVSLGITFFLKLIIMRPRPEVALASYNTFSFPSGHAAAVFSTLAILDREFPRFKWVWILFALLVAFSRLYLGVHYLTDVVVGALIGYSVSLLIVKIWNKRLRE